MIQASARDSSAYFDPKINAWAISVLPGHHKVIDSPDTAVSTLLGSCVAACIRDMRRGIGGLNHFLLPGEDGAGDGARSARYGVHAMEVLINDILRSGSVRQDLEAKIFGGANVIDTAAKETVGDRNSRFVEEYLRLEGIKVTAKDLGGDRARRVFFFPGSGRASVLRLPPSASSRVRAEEKQLARQASAAPKAGGVELF
jgi:chemotaxis protein CheD